MKKTVEEIANERYFEEKDKLIGLSQEKRSILKVISQGCHGVGKKWLVRRVVENRAADEVSIIGIEFLLGTFNILGHFVKAPIWFQTGSFFFFCFFRVLYIEMEEIFNKFGTSTYVLFSNNGPIISVLEDQR